MEKEKLSKLDRIFKATLCLTGKMGIAGLTMSGIAKEANMASGTVYLYFKGKAELLNALHLKLTNDGASAIVEDIRHLSIPIQLYKMWGKALQSLVSNPLRIIFLEQFLISPYVSDRSRDIDSAFIAYLSDLLDCGKREKIIKASDNGMLIALITGFVRNYAFHLLRNSDGLLTEQAIDESFALCWDAIKK